MHRTLFVPLVLAVVPVAMMALTAAGCSSLEDSTPPEIQVSPSSIAFAPTNVGEASTRVVTLRNVGQSTLRISRLELALSSDHVSFEAPGELVLAPTEEQAITLTYAPDSIAETSGFLNVFSNDPANSPAAVAINRVRPVPQLQVFPDPLNFGTVAEGSRSTLEMEVGNLGTAPLILCRAFVEIGSQFESDIDVRVAADARTVDDRLVLPPAGEDSNLVFEVTFAPTRLGAASANLTFQYDRFGDVDAACESGNVETQTVRLTGNGATSELTVDPCTPFIDFGEVPFEATGRRPIRMRNDQELSLQVFGARLLPDLSDPAFRLEALPDFPLGLDPGAQSGFDLLFQPRRLSDEDSRAMAGVLEIEHTDVDGERVTTRCDIAGVGIDRACPVAVGRAFILEDPQVRRSDIISWGVPLQTVVLDATDSFSPAGLGLDYEWEIVAQPNDAFAGLRPYVSDPQNDAFRQFFMPIAGEYEFALRVFDDDGFESCDEARVIVDATPNRTIAVELTWRNPADPDERNDDGSDLDLHFLKVGPGQWFRSPWDVYFANRQPDWLPEQPSLDIDVRNGLGPETITMDNPQDCQWYAVGVHYFNEAWGTALATIRVFVDGQLIHEQGPGQLRSQNDFWDVGRLHWPSGEFFEVNNVLRNFDGSNAAPVSPPSTPEIDALAAEDECFAYP